VGSIRAIREVRKRKATAVIHNNEKKELLDLNPQPQPIDLGAALFGGISSRTNSDNPNPFSTSSQSSSTTSNPFAPLPPTSSLAAKSPQRPEEPLTETFASKLQISSPPPPPSKSSTSSEPWPPESTFLKPFPHLHLDADYETLVPERPSIPDTAASSSKAQSQYAEEDSTTTSILDKDSFESSLDKTFLKFSDRLAQNPEQVLRYEWKGIPLLYSGTDTVGKQLSASYTKTKAASRMPRCDSCGAERVFELQLVPGAIAALEGEEEVNLEDGMEWGTIIVGVCGKNCSEVGEVVFKEEWCGVQWEERG
jgi:pre-rRNA-processing protein TSR4